MSTGPNLGSLAVAAERLQCNPRTIRRMVARGDLAAYRIGNARLIRVDLDEVDALLRRIPTACGGDAA